MSMASEVMKLIFAVLDVSCNSGHFTVIIKRQFLYTNITFAFNMRHIPAKLHQFPPSSFRDFLQTDRPTHTVTDTDAAA